MPQPPKDGLSFVEDAHKLLTQALQDVAAMRSEQQTFLSELKVQFGSFKAAAGLKLAADAPAVENGQPEELKLAAVEATVANSQPGGEEEKADETKIVPPPLHHLASRVSMVDWKAIPAVWPSKPKRTELYKKELEKEAGLEEATSWRDRGAVMVSSSSFEGAMGIIILLNLAAMFARTQYRSSNTAFVIGLQSHNDGWSSKEPLFEASEIVFCIFYLSEIFLRAFFLGWSHYRRLWNAADAVIVVVSTTETLLTTILGDSSGASLTPVLRLFRMARVARFAKITRMAQGFGDLRVIMRTLLLSVGGLFWASLLLFAIITGGGLFITELLLPFMLDSDVRLEDRTYMFEKYGTAARATYSMWEHTFTGRWTPDARRMYENLNGFFVIFWMFWIVGVNFAVMRVIAALFLKQTMSVANDDANKMAVAKMKEREAFANTIRDVFMAADQDQSGAISEEEFVGMIYDPKVSDNFIHLGLELFEVTVLFRLLSDEDGEADYDEFLKGATRLNEHASNTDVIKLMHELTQIRREIRHIIDIHGNLHTTLHKHLHKNHPV